MLKTRSILVCLTAASALLLAACDTQEEQAAQPEEKVASETGPEALTGTLDRSFAESEIPEVVLTDPQGRELDLTDTSGKPVLMNLWATWCAPCVAEMPLLDDLAATLGDDVQVITVSEDMQGAEKVVPFFEENDLTNLPQWMDPTNELAFHFGGGAVLPLTVLYDAEGREVWRVIGAYDWGSEDAVAQVREALAEAEGQGR